jgi:nucleoside 2-deoxyribosyltransferase
MTTVCLCGSFRHHDAMPELRRALLATGAACEWPEAGLRRDPESTAPEESRAAILHHLGRMDRADVILVCNPDGYVGRSVAMKIGYAHAREKPVYALAPIADRFLMAPVTDVVGPGDLARLVRRHG